MSRSATKKVRARWPFTGAVSVHVEKINDADDEATVLVEVERPDGQYLNVSVPRSEFILAVRAADGDEAAAVHLRFLQEAHS
ncbi:hypothetical protein [Humibacter sp.]|uniref:hypothetical protein n=1 Tax=Humibacter sp. TaxID=1940291 RepID=UPI003F7F418D